MTLHPPPRSARVVAISDAAAGNHRQASALAGQLEPGFTTLTLDPDWRARLWAPRRFPGAAGALGPEFAQLLVHPPALAVGCGRQAALATRLLRSAGSRVVQVLDPRIDPAHWDRVVAPRHDGLRGTNVITLDGSLNPVDDLWLAQGRAAFRAFGQLPAPRVALLVGGPGKHWRYADAQFTAALGALRDAIAALGGSLLASASRRTPSSWRAALQACDAALACGNPDVAPNPYPGMLGWADAIVCTADSVNMLSEACATMAPVHVIGGTCLRGRPKRFLDALADRGRIRPFTPALAPFAVTPLRETARVAHTLRAWLEHHGRPEDGAGHR